MTYIGNVPDFNKSERFDLYIERFERWLAANEVPEGKKADILLATLPALTYELLRDLVSPRTTTECSYEDLKQVLIQHFMPNPITIAERFRFYRRSQEEGETLAEFIDALKKLAHTCDFKDFLNDALRDRFVCGLRDEYYINRLLIERTLTFKSACDIALGLELARRDARQLTQTAVPQIQGIQKVQVQTRSTKKKLAAPRASSASTSSTCYRCGYHHLHQDCPFKKEVCRNCGKKGHIARVCKSKTRAQHQISSQESPQDDYVTLYPVDGDTQCRRRHRSPAANCRKCCKNAA